MKFVTTARLLSIGSLTPTSAGELWFDNTVSEATLAFYDGTNTQRVVTKSLLSSTSNGDGASLVGVEQTLANLAGTNVQTVLASIDAKIGTLESGLNWEEQVISITSTPPGSPNEGDRYIVGDTATGAWVGEDGAIATYDGSVWLFQDISASNEGTVVYVLSEDKAYVVDSSGDWVAFSSIISHGNLTGLQGGTTNEHYHLTQAYYNLVNALDSASDNEGASLIKVATTASLGSFTGQGAGGSLQAVLESLATINSTSAGQGASLIGIEDSAANFTATTVEGALAELYDEALKIYRSGSTEFTAGQTIQFNHGLGSAQVQVLVQKDNGSGIAGEHVLAEIIPTNGSETTTVSVTIDEAGDYFVTAIG